MRIMNKSILMLLALLIGFTSNAQQRKKAVDVVVVVLKDGTTFSGEVKNWKVGKEITIISQAGNEYSFDGEDIEKIMEQKYYEKNLNLQFKEPYNFKEEGIYYALRGHFIKGNFGDRQNESHGAGISGLIGKRFNRFVGIGVGAGYDSYIVDSGESVLPIFAELTGYFTPTNNSLSYGLAAGYGLAFANQDKNIIDAKGGLMVHPNIGLRFGTKSLKYTLDLGYKFQKAQFTFRNIWDGRSRFEQRLLYKRVTLRFGVLI